MITLTGLAVTVFTKTLTVLACEVIHGRGKALLPCPPPNPGLDTCKTRQHVCQVMASALG